MEERDLLQRAADALTNETGLKVKLIERAFFDYNDEWDARLEIEMPDQYDDLELFVEAKTRMSRAALGPLKYQLDRAHGTGVLVTEYINPAIANDLKKLGIQFFDAWGNAYINHAPLYIFVKGNRRVRDYDTHTPRTIRPTFLKVLFALLCTPGLEDEPLRKIARIANVALGAVPAAFKDLERTGNLIDKGRGGRRLIRKEKLLERWVAAYPEVLRPKVILGRYTALDRQWWTNADLPKHCFWGGEVAAAKMTRYLKPEIITIYTPRIHRDLLLENRLRKDEHGEIEVLGVFWIKDIARRVSNEGEFYKGHENLVHPILVYADLIGTEDARTHETAKIIYDNEITKLIREN